MTLPRMVECAIRLERGQKGKMAAVNLRAA